ncbi:MAG: hypothetical protein WB420_24960 [Bradyrhizobium sp.]
MLRQPEKVPLFLKAKELAFFGSFFGLALLAAVAWVYLLGSIFLKFMVWCFS